ncbi:uncharacterized protein [Henckelia pumila]|uniref:uncharacterized protein n=1 Tax=Henckelia pumila TaxID=405737 RepID=UPI003C6DC52F
MRSGHSRTFPTSSGTEKILASGRGLFFQMGGSGAFGKNNRRRGDEFFVEEYSMSVGLPRKLVSDNGRQFQGQKLADWCAEMDIKQAFTSVAYPQSNGSVAWNGEGLGRGDPECVVGIPNHSSYCSQESPFSLVYGSEAILPVEIGQPSARIKAYKGTEEGARTQELDLIEEQRENTARRMEAYRARVMRAYNQKVKPREFQEGEFVLKRVNPAGEVRKLDA